MANASTCLRIPEILSMVSESLTPSELAPLLRVSKDFFANVAPGLWHRRDETTLEELLVVLMNQEVPLQCIGDSESLELPLDAAAAATKEQWARFNSYASGVRNLRLEDSRRDGSPRNYVLTRIWNVHDFKCRLPRLRKMTVDWSEESPTECLILRKLLSMLDAPSCTSMQVLGQGYQLSFGSDDNTRGELDLIGKDCAGPDYLWAVLEAVRAHMPQFSSLERLQEETSGRFGFPRLASELSSMQFLSSLTMNLAMLGSDGVLTSVGRLPNLQRLGVYDGSEGGRGNGVQALAVSDSAFPKLVELDIYAAHQVQPMVWLFRMRVLVMRVETFYICCPPKDRFLLVIFQQLRVGAFRLKSLTFNATGFEGNGTVGAMQLFPLTEIQLSELTIKGVPVDLDDLLEHPCHAWHASLNHLAIPAKSPAIHTDNLRKLAGFTSLRSLVAPIAPPRESPAQLNPPEPISEQTLLLKATYLRFVNEGPEIDGMAR
ncbi:hypothetical protein FRC10_000606 [Ceratobasidium sp. 414]|nr:hypothetical protein FRC10_000606 [Ceratobasidium sp. 414]